MSDPGKYTIKQWAEDDRPREKMLLKGAASLSNAELIAILIGSGSTELSAVELSKQILTDAGDNLAELARLTLKDLLKYKGIGEAKAITIMAALELSKRRHSSFLLEKPVISSSDAAFRILQAELGDLQYENFCVILLNRANKLIRTLKISDGGLTGTVVDPRKVFKLALDHNATSIILGHNHPSGQLKPSDLDIKLTNQLRDAGKMLEVTILDHLIIGDGKYFSFADEGMM